MNAIATVLLAVSTLSSPKELADYLDGGCTNERPFAFTAEVCVGIESAGRRIFAVRDDSGSVVLDAFRTKAFFSDALSPGDVVRVSGRVEYNPAFNVPALCDRLEVVGRKEPVEPPFVSVGDMLRGAWNYRPARLAGTVVEYRDDEMDPHWAYFLVEDMHHDRIYVFFPRKDGEFSHPERFIGAEVVLRGLVTSLHAGPRRYLGPMFNITSHGLLGVVRPTASDPFSVERLGNVCTIGSQAVSALGRRRVSGAVLAVWHETRLLLRADDGRLVEVEMASVGMPAPGMRIEVAGDVRTDVYHLMLLRSVWRRIDGEAPGSVSENVTAVSLMRNEAGETMVQAGFHGRRIRLRGTVRALGQDLGRRIVLEDGGELFSVDRGTCENAFDGIEPGAVVEADGICVMESTSEDKRHESLPRIDGFAVVLTGSDGLAVLARPPWWTPRKLTIVIGSLFVLLIGILVWNRVLNRMVERRGRALMREKFAKEAMELRNEERMRLAVELHDTISQELTGVALLLEAGDQAAAGRMLRNCRDNLRDMLWDLRSRAFEERRLSEAIRRTVEPHRGAAEVRVHCQIPSRDLSDNAVHAILCILRELVVNAVRHGGARHVAIAGSADADGIHFSVKDDGRGFDPATRPGTSAGHFGLQGVAERVRRLGGTFEIESAPGCGAYAIIRNLECQG